MLDLRDDCARHFAQPQFAAIHDKVTYLSRPTDEMVFAHMLEKPSVAERTALRAFFPFAVDCEMRSLALMQPNQAPIMLAYQVTQSARIGGLSLLTEGQLTYGQYAMIMRMEADKPALIAEMRAKQQAEQEAIITLSCVIQDSPNLMGQNMNGVEFQYTIDPARKTAVASRGAVPSNFQISPTLITFNQGEWDVSISRATGTFTQSVTNNPYHMSGICEPVHATKF